MIRPILLATTLAFTGIVACSTTHAQTETQNVPNTSATSNADFATTNQRLEAAIDSRSLILFNKIDHAAGAAKIDLELAPNTLYIFGNPQGGTPLMLANPALGLALPLKANVREEGGEIIVTVTDIRAITAAAGVSEPAPVIAKIEGALSAILTEATGG